MIAQQGHVVYLHHSKKGYFKWNLASNDQLESVPKPNDQQVHWIRYRTQVDISASVEPDAIRVDEGIGDAWPEVIPTPVKVKGTGLGSAFDYIEIAEGVRLIYGRVDDYIVIYDRKTKKWLGRFKARPFNGNKPDEVLINQDATLLVIVPENGADTILVFDLPELE